MILFMENEDDDCGERYWERPCERMSNDSAGESTGESALPLAVQEMSITAD